MSLLTFDLETTGVDVYNDRIVTAFAGLMESDGTFYAKRDWMVDPGIEIPEGASSVHGITTEIAREKGRKDAPAALQEIVDIIRYETSRGVPLVIYNAPYDLTLLREECIRHGVEPLDLTDVLVLDPLVIDKGIDRYRRGKRTLVVTAAHYGVPVEANAHDAGADCLMTGRVMLAMFRKPRFFDTPASLQLKQKAWKREQAHSFQEYLRKTDPAAVVNPEWPIQTLKPEGVAA